ncbi:MAG: cysteine--tRNA ligase [Candidatus Micrarchaeota archaeon]
MALEIHNTLSGKKEEFKPIKGKEVRMYVCGITPYSASHIGHGRCYVVWDTLRRYLAFRGWKTTYVQNFTDIDDKIINKAKELKEDPFKLSARYIEEYFGEFDALNVKRADEYPKVTEHIPEIIGMIGKLIGNGFAYESKGDVFFEVGKFEEYGKLSKQSLDELIKGKRIEINQNKRNPADFALWKSAKEGEPFWDSPWGKGRPGWHIECSAMAAKYLGEQFDLHCGGQDLIFPHHENEIAQAEGASGKKPFAKYWMHNGFVTIRKEKMAKSVGNILPLSEMLKKYDGETVRFFYLSTQYRQPLDYSDESVMQAKESLASLKNAIWRLQQKNAVDAEKISDGDLLKIRESFLNAMDDDLNTPEAISVLFELKNFAFEMMDDGEKGELLGECLHLFREFGGILGIFEKEGKGNAGIEEGEIRRMIAERDDAKKRKDWKRADEIREVLKEKGVQLEDNKDGSTSWRNAN